MESNVYTYKNVRMTQHTHKHTHTNKPRIWHKTKPSAQDRHFIYMYVYMSVPSVLKFLYIILVFLLVACTFTVGGKVKVSKLYKKNKQVY